MTAVFGILSFLAVVTGLAAAYRVWERRSPIQPPLVPLSETKGDGGGAEAAISRSPSPVVAPSPSNYPLAPSPAVAAAAKPVPTATVQPMIPDPWADEPDITEPIAPPSAATAVEVPVAISPLLNLETTDAAGLMAAIAQMGRSGQLQQIPNLSRYLNSTDSQIRETAATALGNLAINRRGTTVESIVPRLGKLCQDRNVDVRCAAVAALGNIQSAKVLPLLQQAQKQPNSRVSQTATTALQKLKLIYQSKPAAPARAVTTEPKTK